MPKHWLHLYQRPVQGSAFLGRWECFNYRHKISSAGGFDTASFELALTRDEAERLFEQLGCQVEIYVDPPSPIWEGFLNRVSLAVGTLTYTASLDELCNRVSCTYSAPDISANTQNRTAVNDTTSQAIYGVKEGALDGYLIEGTNATKMDALQQMVLATQAYPQKSTTFNPEGQGSGLLSVECLGWYHSLQWVKYTNTAAAGADDADVHMINLLAAYPNTSFFSVSDTSLITANPAFAQNRRTRIGQTIWENMQAIREAGDGSSKWVMGITPKDLIDGTRRFYYRILNSTVDYILRSKEGRVANIYGQYVLPWRVQPDRACRINDFYVGWDGMGDDPSEFYIDTIDYEANSQSVQFGSTDNITAEGVFNLRHYFKRTGRRFGAPVRRTM